MVVITDQRDERKRTMNVQAIAAILGVCALPAPPYAEDAAPNKMPEKTIGDEGKLPPSQVVREQVPDMTSPEVTAKENIRPATQAMDRAVPEVKGPEVKTE